MKVLLITNLFPTPADPERGVFTLQLAKRLNKICELTVICPLPWFPKTSLLKNFERWYQLSEVPEQYSIDEIGVYSPKYILIPKISESFHHLLMRYWLSPFIKKLHKKNNYAVINSQWLYPDSVAVDAIANTLNIPHVATGLGCDVNDNLYQKGKAAQILNMLEQASAITVVSSRLKDELVRSGVKSDKVSVILNGVDIERFKLLEKNSCREKLNIETDKKLILYVGRLSYEKCVASLISAFALIYKEDPTLSLALVGEGPELADLTALCKANKIENSVHFVGKIAHTELNAWFAAADVFCLPSKREGCPNVVLEALACGCPVVASDVGALPDLVSGATGLLFEPEDVNDMSNKLSEAMQKKWDRTMIHASMKDATWEQAALQYYHAFENAARKN